MKRLLCAAACLLVAGMSFAQTDGTSKNTDTVQVGNFIFIKNKDRDNTISENNDRKYLYTREYSTNASFLTGAYFREIHHTNRIIIRNSFRNFFRNIGRIFCGRNSDYRVVGRVIFPHPFLTITRKQISI